MFSHNAGPKTPPGFYKAKEEYTTKTASDVGTDPGEPVPQHRGMKPGESFSYFFDSDGDDAFFQAGKLNLTFSRESPPPSATQNTPACILKVRWPYKEEQHHRTDSNESGEIIDARDIAKGEAVTADRGGWLSEQDLMVFCGWGAPVAIRYGQGSSR